jgi:hypothetical protein
VLLRRFDDFVQEFNTERPHEALAMKCPAEIYAASSQPYSGLPDLTYPPHDRDVLGTACGRICMHRKRVNILTVLAGQRLGIKEVDDGICIVSFTHYDPGFVDLEQKTLQLLRHRVVTHALGTFRYVCLLSAHSRPPGSDQDWNPEYRPKLL